MNNLSEAEVFFNTTIRKFECMTVSQAMSIMKKYMNCSFSQTNIILSQLAARENLMIKEDKYIIAGGKRDGAKIRINRGLVHCLYYAIDQIETTDEFEMMYQPLNGATLAYVSGNRMYQLLYLTSDTLMKAAILQNQYNDSIKKLNKHASKEDFTYTTCFVFGPKESEENVLTKLDSLDISMPHKIIFVKTKNLTDKPQYHIYQPSE